ncbi:uncharacterized protein LOC115630809 [Scaptodrosophila lebanonensis]|uniref:Cilia- and flagella-associated protein 91 n=1 Tax=Drosophila lebanonensis TaxID=7225 RepID=A0A6J2U852_DROLE|nr:uncharacterized protein LOC115630809 [Scaptodrosophila lebanonensis]
MPAPYRASAKVQSPTIEVLHESHYFRRCTSKQSLQSTMSSKSMKSVKSATSGKTTLELPRHTKRVTFSKPSIEKPLNREIEIQTGLTSCLITTPTLEQRHSGGANNPAERKVIGAPRTASECKISAPGIDYLMGSKEPTVASFELKIDATPPPLLKNKCGFFPKYVDSSPFKEQATQTLYRESSAQTLPYLPEIVDKELAEGLELFKLSTLLPGDKPPGLYEVEILERARKRWAFTSALKTNFKRQLHEARELAIKSKYKTILQAFEWEHWIEREEYIQECQMMRLEIVIRMFDKREQEMHTASKTRIELACDRIEQRRLAGLKKNETEFHRANRRLLWKHTNTSRKWSKQHPIVALGSPTSEFYAPLIRNGVDPARGHFQCTQKTFDMRIDDLEKRVDMNQLECPFTKLREWSRPKETVKEYEQNFCSDANLQKLYESLKGLRTQAAKQKMSPKCLKKRYHAEPPRETVRREIYEYAETDYSAYYKKTETPDADKEKTEQFTPEQLLAFQRHCANAEVPTQQQAKELLAERCQEDLENLLYMYEGTTIGWVMQFLSEEMERLKEQRKMHFFSILAQKERWRREAAEAGLRQKENEMRNLYEELFQECNLTNSEVSKEYIKSILTTDMSHIETKEANESIQELAKRIDKDIKHWLDSFKLVQTPLTYEPLRYALRDIVYPDLNSALEAREKESMSKYIIEEVLFPKIWDELEPYDIASALTSDLVDRLIDNDLYLFSTDSESDTNSASIEAGAIIRKVIRQAVPGRRWKTEVERIAHENYNDLFDDVFDEILRNFLTGADLPPAEPSVVHYVNERALIFEFDDLKFEDPYLKLPSLAHEDSEIIRTQVLSLLKKLKTDFVTKTLASDDKYEGDDNFKDSDPDTLIAYEIYNRATKNNVELEEIYSILSTLDIGDLPDFKILKAYQAWKKERAETEKSSSLSDIGVVFDKKETREEAQQTSSHDTLLGIIDAIVSSEEETDVADQNLFDSEEEINYEADEEQSWKELTEPSAPLLIPEEEAPEVPIELEAPDLNLVVEEEQNETEAVLKCEQISEVVTPTPVAPLPAPDIDDGADTSSFFSTKLSSTIHSGSSYSLIKSGSHIIPNVAVNDLSPEVQRE